MSLLPRLAAALATTASALLLGACVTPPVPGQAQAEVLGRWGAPTSRYALPGGASRLEYATGPFGRSTWMVDVDAGGRVTQARQVLTEGFLFELQGRLPGMPADELLRTLGRPGNKRGGGFLQGGEVWSWRYETLECLWFQVSVRDDGRASDGGFYPDPSCERANGSAL
jgi:hypothetical protein